MMSSEPIPPMSETQSSGDRKATAAAGQEHQPPLKCPRCDSANTKFCYYNNYSLSQPRHFCKTCRRYWTRGGALRNVPIGGGCRKSKKSKPTASSRILPINPAPDFGPGPMEFQLGGLSLPRLHPATAGVYTQFVSGSGPGFGLDLFGLNYPLPTTTTTTSPPQGISSSIGGDQSVNISSIESLSSINQEMHWKLQQQRLALIYGDHHDHDHDHHDENEKPLAAINLFQQLEIYNNNNNNSGATVGKGTTNCTNSSSNDEASRGNRRKLEVGPTEWFFDQASYVARSNNSTSTTTTSHNHNNSSNNNHSCSALITTREEAETTAADFEPSAIATTAAAATVGWSDFHQFSGLH